MNGNKRFDCFKDTGATEGSVKLRREGMEKWEQRLHTITGVSSRGKDLKITAPEDMWKSSRKRQKLTWQGKTV